jgi:hypothetical protein
MLWLELFDCGERPAVDVGIGDSFFSSGSPGCTGREGRSRCAPSPCSCVRSGQISFHRPDRDYSNRGPFRRHLRSDPRVASDGLGLSQGLADAIGVAAVVTTITYTSLIVGELVPKQIALRDRSGCGPRCTRDGPAFENLFTTGLAA